MSSGQPQIERGFEASLHIRSGSRISKQTRGVQRDAFKRQTVMRAAAGRKKDGARDVRERQAEIGGHSEHDDEEGADNAEEMEVDDSDHDDDDYDDEDDDDCDGLHDDDEEDEDEDEEDEQECEDHDEADVRYTKGKGIRRRMNEENGERMVRANAPAVKNKFFDAQRKLYRSSPWTRASVK